MTTVSVIIPTYNYGPFIKAAIDSVLIQTYPVSEVIVIDDGSTDETEEIVGTFGDKVRYVKQPNQGVSAARNLGVQYASGDLIAFLDADDTWRPDKLEKQVGKFDDLAVGLVHCGMLEFDSATGETIGFELVGEEGWVADDLVLFERPVVIASGSVIIVRRKVIESVGGFDRELKNGEDWEFCVRVARKHKIGFVPEPLVNYRNHGVNATKNLAEMERSTGIAWRKIFDVEDEAIQHLKRRSYGNLHKVLAGSYLHNGEYLGFTRNVLKSLWFRPTYLGYYLKLLVKRQMRTHK